MATSTKTKADVLVIGGGATGIGIARDAALRGFSTVLVEQGGMGFGTSGHFHGMLHSGARYAVDDVLVAAECYKENQILRRIASPAILDTGGLFLALNSAEVAYADTLMAACTRAGIPIADVSLEAVAAQEPNVTPSLQRALSVPDAYIDGSRLLHITRESAESADVPATFLMHHQVVGLHSRNGRLESVQIKNASGDTITIECGFVVNAAGAWAGRIASLAGIAIEMVLDKGVMVVLQERLNTAVLNRCRPQADGDILVPTWEHCIMGTTSHRTDNPGAIAVDPADIPLLIQEGAQMVPRLSQATIKTAYAGVRPLFNALNGLNSAAGRSVSRSYQVLDHATEGVNNFISVVGGKLTVYRQMAETAVDLLCQKQHITRPCQTANSDMTQSSHRDPTPILSTR